MLLYYLQIRKYPGYIRKFEILQGYICKFPKIKSQLAQFHPRQSQPLDNRGDYLLLHEGYRFDGNQERILSEILRTGPS